MSELDRIKKCVDIIRSKTDFVPKTAVVLGSGLGGFADEIDIVKSVSYNEIEGFPVSTVSGHEGRFVFGYVEKEPCVLMQGRVHYYEGYSMKDVVLPIRVMKLLGAERLVLTNAAGGISDEINEGSLVLIRDHISSFVHSPLIGENIDELGERFPDMTEVYSKKWQEQIRKSAKELEVDLKEGVYLQTTGPNYESPIEIQMYKKLGADLVGMSTVCEAMVARHMRMEICAISCVTNKAAGLGGNELTHEEVKEVAAKVSGEFKSLLRKIIV